MKTKLIFKKNEIQGCLFNEDRFRSKIPFYWNLSNNWKSNQYGLIHEIHTFNYLVWARTSSFNKFSQTWSKHVHALFCLHSSSISPLIKILPFCLCIPFFPLKHWQLLDITHLHKTKVVLNYLVFWNSCVMRKDHYLCRKKVRDIVLFVFIHLSSFFPCRTFPVLLSFLNLLFVNIVVLLVFQIGGPRWRSGFIFDILLMISFRWTLQVRSFLCYPNHQEKLYDIHKPKRPFCWFFLNHQHKTGAGNGP